jgi:hypothetical protein
MNKRIIYKRDDGGVSVIVPTGELTVEETARKDVPTGNPYKIVDVADIPSDRSLRDSWTIDEAELVDGVGE